MLGCFAGRRSGVEREPAIQATKLGMQGSKHKCPLEQFEQVGTQVAIHTTAQQASDRTRKPGAESPGHPRVQNKVVVVPPVVACELPEAAAMAFVSKTWLLPQDH